jgi:hypothetical protein
MRNQLHQFQIKSLLDGHEMGRFEDHLARAISRAKHDLEIMDRTNDPAGLYCTDPDLATPVFMGPVPADTTMIVKVNA